MTYEPLSPTSASRSPLSVVADNSPPTTKPFRFKRKRSDHPSTHTKSTNHHHRHHHHNRTHRTHRRRSPTTPPVPDSYSPDTHGLNPDHAFRESLFDALADDEGAAFWEGVYGQPIHTYSAYYDSPHHEKDDAKAAAGEQDETNVHRMTEDDYVDYVRAKMWERSHQHVLEERARREEARAERRREERRRQRQRMGERDEEEGRKERQGWHESVEEVLRRGEERRRVGRWKGVWRKYVDGWDGMRWDEDKAADRPKISLKERIPWPVESGAWRDVLRTGEVDRFFERAPLAAHAAGGADGGKMADVLKKERVRWHPDKIQQRAGANGTDPETLKMVTAVFQVIDRLWVQARGKE